MDAVSERTLGNSSETITLSGREACRQAVEQMSTQAKHSIYIFSRDLDPPLFSNNSFVDAVRHIIADDKSATVKILLYDVEYVVQHGHRLIDLYQRASTSVQIRKLPKAYHHAFFVADETGVIDRKRAERYDANASFNAPGWASDLISFFNDCWNQSSPATGLTGVHI